MEYSRRFTSLEEQNQPKKYLSVAHYMSDALTSSPYYASLKEYARSRGEDFYEDFRQKMILIGSGQLETPADGRVWDQKTYDDLAGNQNDQLAVVYNYYFNDDTASYNSFYNLSKQAAEQARKDKEYNELSKAKKGAYNFGVGLGEFVGSIGATLADGVIGLFNLWWDTTVASEGARLSAFYTARREGISYGEALDKEYREWRNYVKDPNLDTTVQGAMTEAIRNSYGGQMSDFRTEYRAGTLGDMFFTGDSQEMFQLMKPSAGIIQGVADNIAQMLVSLIPGAGQSIYMGQMIGSVYQNTIKEEGYNELETWQQLALAGMNIATELGTELLFKDGVLEKGLIPGAYKLNTALTKAGVKNTFVRGMANFMAHGLEEGTEEVLNQVLQDGFAAAIKSKDMSVFWEAQDPQQILLAGVAGAISGVLFTGAHFLMSPKVSITTASGKTIQLSKFDSYMFASTEREAFEQLMNQPTAVGKLVNEVSSIVNKRDGTAVALTAADVAAMPEYAERYQKAVREDEQAAQVLMNAMTVLTEAVKQCGGDKMSAALSAATSSFRDKAEMMYNFFDNTQIAGNVVAQMYNAEFETSGHNIQVVPGTRDNLAARNAIEALTGAKVVIVKQGTLYGSTGWSAWEQYGDYILIDERYANSSSGMDLIKGQIAKSEVLKTFRQKVGKTLLGKRVLREVRSIMKLGLSMDQAAAIDSIDAQRMEAIELEALLFSPKVIDAMTKVNHSATKKIIKTSFDMLKGAIANIKKTGASYGELQETLKLVRNIANSYGAAVQDRNNEQHTKYQDTKDTQYKVHSWQEVNGEMQFTTRNDQGEVSALENWDSVDAFIDAPVELNLGALSEQQAKNFLDEQTIDPSYEYVDIRRYNPDFVNSIQQDDMLGTITDEETGVTKFGAKDANFSSKLKDFVSNEYSVDLSDDGTFKAQVFARDIADGVMSNVNRIKIREGASKRAGSLMGGNYARLNAFIDGLPKAYDLDGVIESTNAKLTDTMVFKHVDVITGALDIFKLLIADSNLANNRFVTDLLNNAVEIDKDTDISGYFSEAEMTELSDLTDKAVSQALNEILAPLYAKNNGRSISDFLLAKLKFYDLVVQYRVLLEQVLSAKNEYFVLLSALSSEDSTYTDVSDALADRRIDLQYSALSLFGANTQYTLGAVEDALERNLEAYLANDDPRIIHIANSDVFGDDVMEYMRSIGLDIDSVYQIALTTISESEDAITEGDYVSLGETFLGGVRWFRGEPDIKGETIEISEKKLPALYSKVKALVSNAPQGANLSDLIFTECKNEIEREYYWLFKNPSVSVTPDSNVGAAGVLRDMYMAIAKRVADGEPFTICATYMAALKPNTSDLDKTVYVLNGNRTVIHEDTHFLQFLFGTHSGGSGRQMRELVDNSRHHVTEAISKNRKSVAEFLIGINELYKRPEGYDADGYIIDSYFNYSGEDTEKKNESKQFREAIDGLAADPMRDVDISIARYNFFDQYGTKVGNILYSMLRGEVEARTAQQNESSLESDLRDTPVVSYVKHSDGTTTLEGNKFARDLGLTPLELTFDPEEGYRQDGSYMKETSKFADMRLYNETEYIDRTSVSMLEDDNPERLAIKDIAKNIQVDEKVSDAVTEIAQVIANIANPNIGVLSFSEALDCITQGNNVKEAVKLDPETVLRATYRMQQAINMLKNGAITPTTQEEINIIESWRDNAAQALADARSNDAAQQQSDVEQLVEDIQTILDQENEDPEFDADAVLDEYANVFCNVLPVQTPGEFRTEKAKDALSNQFAEGKTGGYTDESIYDPEFVDNVKAYANVKSAQVGGQEISDWHASLNVFLMDMFGCMINADGTFTPIITNAVTQNGMNVAVYRVIMAGVQQQRGLVTKVEDTIKIGSSFISPDVVMSEDFLALMESLGLKKNMFNFVVLKNTSTTDRGLRQSIYIGKDNKNQSKFDFIKRWYNTSNHKGFTVTAEEKQQFIDALAVTSKVKGKDVTTPIFETKYADMRAEDKAIVDTLVNNIISAIKQKQEKFSMAFAFVNDATMKVAAADPSIAAKQIAEALYHEATHIVQSYMGLDAGTSSSAVRAVVMSARDRVKAVGGKVATQEWLTFFKNLQGIIDKPMYKKAFGTKEKDTLNNLITQLEQVLEITDEKAVVDKFMRVMGSNGAKMLYALSNGELLAQMTDISSVSSETLPGWSFVDGGIVGNSGLMQELGFPTTFGLENVVASRADSESSALEGQLTLGLGRADVRDLIKGGTLTTQEEKELIAEINPELLAIYNWLKGKDFYDKTNTVDTLYSALSVLSESAREKAFQSFADRNKTFEQCVNDMWSKLGADIYKVYSALIQSQSTTERGANELSYFARYLLTKKGAADKLFTRESYEAWRKKEYTQAMTNVSMEARTQKGETIDASENIADESTTDGSYEINLDTIDGDVSEQTEYTEETRKSTFEDLLEMVKEKAKENEGNERAQAKFKREIKYKTLESPKYKNILTKEQAKEILSILPDPIKNIRQNIGRALYGKDGSAKKPAKNSFEATRKALGMRPYTEEFPIKNDQEYDYYEEYLAKLDAAKKALKEETRVKVETRNKVTAEDVTETLAQETASEPFAQAQPAKPKTRIKATAGDILSMFRQSISSDETSMLEGEEGATKSVAGVDVTTRTSAEDIIEAKSPSGLSKRLFNFKTDKGKIGLIGADGIVMKNQTDVVMSEFYQDIVDFSNASFEEQTKFIQEFVQAIKKDADEMRGMDDDNRFNIAPIVVAMMQLHKEGPGAEAYVGKENKNGDTKLKTVLSSEAKANKAIYKANIKLLKSAYDRIESNAGRVLAAASVAQRLFPTAIEKELTMAGLWGNGDKYSPLVKAYQDALNNALEGNGSFEAVWKAKDEILRQIVIDSPTAVELWKEGTLDGRKKAITTILDKFASIRYLSMLSRPSTFAKNFTSNSAMTLVDFVAEEVTRGVQKALVAKSKTMSALFDEGQFDSTYHGPASDDVKAFVKANYMDNNLLEFRLRGNSKYDTGIISEDKAGAKYPFKKYTKEELAKLSGAERAKALASNAMANVSNAIFGFLDETDIKFELPYARRKLETMLQNYCKVNNIKASEVSQEVLELFEREAALQANEVYFRNSNRFSKWVNNIRETSPLFGTILSWSIPFARMSYNITATIYRYSPFGFASAVWDIYKAAKSLEGKAGDYKPDAFFVSKTSKKVSQALVGSTMWALGAVLAALTGALKYDEEAYGGVIEIAGIKITLDAFDPAFSAFMCGAIMTSLGEEDGFSNALKAFADMTLFGDIDDIFSGNDNVGEFAIHTFEDLASSYVPAIWRAIVQAMDPGKKDYRGMSDWEKFGNKFLAQAVPYWSNNKIPDRVNPYTGEDEYIASEYVQSVLRIFSPFKWYAGTDGGDVEAMLQSLEDQYHFQDNYGKNIFTNEFGTYLDINGKKYDIDGPKREQYAKMKAEYVRKILKTTLNSAEFRMAKPEEKASMISSAYSDAQTYTRINYWHTEQGGKYMCTSYTEYAKKAKFVDPKALYVSKKKSPTKFTK